MRGANFLQLRLLEIMASYPLSQYTPLQKLKFLVNKPLPEQLFKNLHRRGTQLQTVNLLIPQNVQKGLNKLQHSPSARNG
jgi:hypothetical protein